MHMMALGQFLFSLPTLSFNDFKRQTSWRHPTNSRVGARPASQSLGPGDDTISLSGLLVPEFAGKRVYLDQLRDEVGDPVVEPFTRSMIDAARPNDVTLRK